MMMFSMDDMVPKDHMLRKIDWDFIYDFAEDKYCADNGRSSMDSVMLIKILFIQYLYGIKSMRQMVKEIEVKVVYCWFLGLDILGPVTHFSTVGKNIPAVLRIRICLNRSFTVFVSWKENFKRKKMIRIYLPHRAEAFLVKAVL